MTPVYICDYIRTPIGRFGGCLSMVRTDDLATVPLRGLMARNASVDWEAVDDVILGCANQAGEDNRNVARMAVLLAGLPVGVTGTTINRLCGSGMDAILAAARQIAAGEADLIIAGGVESMSRAPFVMPKADAAFSRNAEIYDTTIGWRFVNTAMHAAYGTDSMPQTGQNVADDYGISREAQDLMALASQAKA
jgi:acetyl-CoA acetyltransferase